MATHFSFYLSSRGSLRAAARALQLTVFMRAIWAICTIWPVWAHSEVSLKPEPIQITLTQRAVTGRQSDNELSHVRPGDQVEYRAVYANTSQAPVVVVATLPIPQHMVYQPKSAHASSGAAALAATTEAQYAAEPLQRRVVDASGKPKNVPVPYAEYRTMRWNLGAIPAGKKVTVSLRANVAQRSTTPDGSRTSQ